MSQAQLVMRRIKYQPYLFFIGFLLLLLGFPQDASERMRCFAVSSFSPSWRGLQSVKQSALHLLMIPLPGSAANLAQASLEIEQLKQENLRLKTQLASVREWLLEEKRVQEQMERWKALFQKEEVDPSLREFFQRRGAYLVTLLERDLWSIPAKVVFREPASWNSRLWLNIGEKDNEKLRRKIVAKNSPVVVGTALVGVIEYVGPTQSRVRLLSDAGLTPSVRAVRGDDLLAKGELHGNSAPLWRCPNQTLYGVGFNYDYADQEGPARDLRSGTPLSGSKKGEAFPLLRPGDLLITTGMDGIFPPGLRVGVVSRIGPLKEGACSYELEAKAALGNLHELTHVRVFPPLNFEK